MQKLHDLLAGINYTAHAVPEELIVKHLSVDSRRVVDGALFVCLRGEKTDGHKYLDDARKAGAVVAIVDELQPVDIPQVVVSDTAAVLPQLAAAFYDYPAKQLKIIGITGTNGKTTTAYLVRHILEGLGEKCGLIGTVGVYDGNEFHTSELTTPQPQDLHRYFRKMVDNGCGYAVMEVSSHALSLGRVAGIAFTTAALTNISQDHLDYHHNMQEYVAAKARLFTQADKAAIINFDDFYAEEFAQIAEDNGLEISYYSCLSAVSEGLFAIVERVREDGMRFSIYYKDQVFPVETSLIGKFNIYNILLACSIAMSLGFNLKEAVATLGSFHAVPGRFERVRGIDNFTVIVDYAHTPDALENVLKSAQALISNRLLLVFGCGGDRDRSKRPIMGEIAVNYADKVFVTSDNPRTEDPDEIIREIVGNHAGEMVWITDRAKAIRTAIAEARRGDIVVIAGKGHENYQIIGRTKHHFDDREMALAAYEELKQ